MCIRDRQNLEQVRLNKLGTDYEYDSLTERMLAKQTEINNYTNQTYELEQQHRNKIDGLESQLSELSRREAQLSNQYVTSIVAPKSGVVTNLQAQVGQQLRSNELLLNISEGDTELEMILLMPVSAAGFVETGQEVSVRYDSFPHEKFGLFSAAVTDVSSTVLLLSLIHI